MVNERFDLREPEAQRYLEQWCGALHESTLVQKVKNRRCVISDFRDYVENVLFQRFPVQVQDFDAAFESFVKTTNRDHMKAGLMAFDPKVSRCNLKHVETRVESGRFQLLNLKYDKLL